ncbi:MAG: class I SAM-dependent methyltransferase [Nibricoccus sp.]
MSSDHFSTQSAEYAKYRPTYPVELFDWLANCCAERNLAWDCACGSGQATLGLAARFKAVIATDLSRAQLDHAPAACNIEWKVAHAEASGLETGSVDLITVAQALHWFDLVRFWPEVKRTLKPRGVVAIWCYGVLEVDNPQLHAICDHFYRVTVGDFWPPERRIVEAGYKSIDFPFQEIPAPTFHLHVDWSIEQLLGYFASWSATTRYRQARGSDPLPELRSMLAPHFAGETIRVRWPLSLRVGRQSPQ